MKVHTTSAGRDPASFVPGRDLVLGIDPSHGADLPRGVLATDHLSMAERHRIDLAARDALATWRDRVDPQLVEEGLSWSWIWEFDLVRWLCPALTKAGALRAAVRATGAAGLVLADRNAQTATLAQAVAAAEGIPCTVAQGARAAEALAVGPRRPSRAVRLRRGAIAWLTSAGAPSMLRSGSVLIHAYWPLMPLLDHLLDTPGERPAMVLDKRPTSPARGLRTALRGGFLGQPGPLDRRRARKAAVGLRRRIDALEPPVIDGLAIGGALVAELGRVAERRAVRDLASVRVARRAFRRRPPRWMVGAYESEPSARLLYAVARETGVRTLSLAHGAFLIRQVFADLDLCDEAAVFSHAVAPTMTRQDGRVHAVGYPLRDPIAPERPAAPVGDEPRIVVLGQNGVTSTATIDARVTMASYTTAVEAILDTVPRARIVLRPHPSETLGTHATLMARHPTARIEIDPSSDILSVMRSADLCVGGTSTATLQAAMTATPVVVLNVSGLDWPWPLGEGTTAPVAHSREELAAILAGWCATGGVPGRQDLLDALGAERDGTAQLAGLLRIAAPAMHPDHPAGLRPSMEAAAS